VQRSKSGFRPSGVYRVKRRSPPRPAPGRRPRPAPTVRDAPSTVPVPLRTGSGRSGDTSGDGQPEGLRDGARRVQRRRQPPCVRREERVVWCREWPRHRHGLPPALERPTIAPRTTIGHLPPGVSKARGLEGSGPRSDDPASSVPAGRTRVATSSGGFRPGLELHPDGFRHAGPDRPPSEPEASPARTLPGWTARPPAPIPPRARTASQYPGRRRLGGSKRWKAVCIR
jgi:hypothetical protein